jgi:hypothetical protein
VRPLVALAGALVLALVGLGAVGCGGDDSPTIAAPPSPVVPGVPGDYGAITVQAGGRSARVGETVRQALVPLRTARVFDAPESLDEYGLDDPRATVRFAARGTTTPVELRVGDENFDRSGYYVLRVGDDRVWLVLDDQLDPTLELVGAAAT